MRLVFDIEADGLRDDATQVWCLCFADIGPPHTPYDDYRTYKFPPEDVVEWGLGALTEADELIGHNIIDYDLPLLERLYGWTPSPQTRIVDTLIHSRLLRSDRPLPSGCPGSTPPHSLKAWGYRVGRGKLEHDDWTRYTPAMLKRCEEDVKITCLVRERLVQEAEGTGIDWTPSLRIEHDIAKLIVTQEQNGCPLDTALVWRTRLTLVRLMAQTYKLLVPLIPEVPLPKSKQGTWPVKQFLKSGAPTVHAIRYYGDEFTRESTYRTDRIIRTAPINLRSDKQVKEYLTTIGWQPTEWNYKKDKWGKPVRELDGSKIRTSPRLTLDSLESCRWPEDTQEMGIKIVEYLMMAHRESMLKGWIRDVRPDGRISAMALPCGTPTGRMTHRKVVNVPRITSPWGPELRACFTTVPGYTRVGIDLRSCQLRALCHEMEDEEFQRQVVEGEPHVYSAEMANLEADAHMSKKDKGKKLNFTVLFGGGVPKIMTDLGLTKSEATRVIKTFFKNLPALSKLKKKLERQWKEKGYLVGLDGRAIWVRAEHMLLVYLMQAHESVVNKEFMIELWNLSNDLESNLVTTMHDESQWLVRDDHVRKFKGRARQAIRTVNERYSLTCPQDIDINIGSTWAECH